MNPVKGSQDKINWDEVIIYVRPVIRKAINKHVFSKDRFLLQDIEQEIIIKIYNKFHLFNQDKSLNDWVYIVSVNHILDVLRKIKRTTVTNENHSRSIDNCPIPRVESIKVSPSIELLNQLPIKYKEIIIKKYIQGYKQKEIAIQLGLPIGTVSSRIQKGISILKCMVQNESLSHSDCL
ncbi:MAG TPA: sigma-70 family RNA polymerase sigma factor [Bacteroidia bacterium]|nr:sigma-70 family RNA polymerase sigma factor [Bacteroidia bacterium]